MAARTKLAWQGVAVPFPDYGDVPGWVSAISTAGAFATGGVLLVRERNEGRRRDREQQQRELQARASQAATIAVWHGREVRGEKFPRTVTVIRVRNGSELPVYDVQLDVEDATGMKVYVIGLGIVPPGLHDAPVPQEYVESFTRTARGWMRSVGGGEREKSDGPAEAPYSFRVSLRFRDASGRSWRRDVSGLLSPAPGPGGD